MKSNRLLAGTLVLVLIAGLGIPAFSQNSDVFTNSNIQSNPLDLPTPTAIVGTSSFTVLTGPEDFSGSETLIGFDSLGGVVPPPGPFSIDDATFTEFSTAPGWRLLIGLLGGAPDPQLTDEGGISLFRIDFSSTVNRVGLLVGIGPADYEVRFFDNSLALIGIVTVSPVDSFDGGFAGIQSDSPISRVEIVEVNPATSKVGGIDEVRFEFVGQQVEVGGEFLLIDSTALLLAIVQSPATWLTTMTFAIIGVGAFLIIRNPNNIRNIKVILRNYLDRF